MAPRLETVIATGLAPQGPDPRTDAELLSRFIHQHDAQAFALLVQRHAPAVRAVCRSWLTQMADIDDATQATFFVLVRRAESIRQRQALGGWLCKVAENVARRLRPSPRLQYDPLAEPYVEPALPDDTGTILAEEVQRLPENYRRVVQLCYYAGLTTAEAAMQLGWPKGTVLTRLAWAKQTLHQRLVARGIAPAVLVAFVGLPVVAVSPKWQAVTVQGACRLHAGVSTVDLGIASRTLTLTEGVVQTMFWNKIKVLIVGLLVAACVGFGVGRWANAGPNPGPDTRREQQPETPVEAGAGKPSLLAFDRELPAAKEALKDDKAAGLAQGRRREAVIRLPMGVFVKEVDAAPYGGGRLTWNYEEERVSGTLEGSVMGIEFEVQIDAEYSLSSNGTIYGVINSLKVTHLKFPPGDQFGELAQYASLWQLVEPILGDVFTDLPFSYQFRLQGDRMVISNFRMLLTGPTPLGKGAGLMALAGGGGDNEAMMVLAYFQAVGLVIEGSYSAEGKDKPAPKKAAPFFKPRGKGNGQPLNLGAVLGQAK